MARGLPTFVRVYLPWLGRYLPWPGGTYPDLGRYLPFWRGINPGHGGTFLSEAVLILTGGPYLSWGYLPLLGGGYLPWSGECTFLGNLRKYFSLGGCDGPQRIFLFGRVCWACQISKYVKLSKKCQKVKYLDYEGGSQKNKLA